MKQRLKRLKQPILVLLVLLFTLNPLKVFAHDAYFLQVTIDDTKNQYVGNVVQDKASAFNNERKHMEFSIGDFSKVGSTDLPFIKGDDADEIKNDGFVNWLKDTTAGDAPPMTFTFPSKEDKDASVPHATKEDIDKAYVALEMVYYLNDAISIISDNEKMSDAEDLMTTGRNLANAINNESTINGYSITKGMATDSNVGKGFTADDYITIRKNGTVIAEFPYRFDPGYSDKFGSQQYITWHSLMTQANFAYLELGFTTNTGSAILNPGPLETAVVDLLGNMLGGIRSLLGLYELEDLVFNQGIRGSQVWLHGVMPRAWADQVTVFHILFQALAWSIIMFSIVKNLFQKNLSTVNPAMRISLMESIQNLLITGFILSLSYPILNMLMTFNGRIVDIFGSLVLEGDALGGASGYSNLLGGLIIQFVYLGLSIYFNFIYIMRGIMLALLIATAPIFIVFISFGGKHKQIFFTWFKEIIANLFIQSFHAFALVFFFSVQSSTRGIEGIVVLISLIPLTKFFKTLLLGQSGGMTDSLGGSALGMATGAVGGAMGAMSGKGKSKSDGGKESGGKSSQSSSSTSHESSANGGNSYAGNSDKISQNSQANTSTRSKEGATRETMAMKNGPDSKEGTAIGGKAGSPYGGVSNPTTGKERIQGRVEQARDGFKKRAPQAKKLGSAMGSVAKGVIGAGAMATGASVALATGLDDSNISRGATDVMKSGFGGVKSAGGDAMNSIRNHSNTLGGDDNTYAQTLDNGDIEVNRSGAMMELEGISHAEMNGDGHAVYTYNDNMENPVPPEAVKTFQSGTKKQQEHYKEQGIEHVGFNADGKMRVTYNEAGMERMNIKSVRTQGNGKNKRIIETKKPNSTLETLKKLNYNDRMGDQQDSNSNN